MDTSLEKTPSAEVVKDLIAGNGEKHLPISQWDLTGLDLSGANLSGLDLSHVDFRGANLSGASLEKANLTNASLCRTALEKTNLLGAILQNCSIQWARYDHETLWPEGFDFRNSGAIGPRANLGGAYFNTANLRGANLEGAMMLGSYVSGADFTGANMAGVRLSGSDMRRCYLTGAYLKGASLNSVNLTDVDLRGADLTDVQFDHLESIAGADFGDVQGLSDDVRARLLSRPATELDKWNPFTRRSTRDSLNRVD